ncbi:teicoplanin resistance protein VanJ [Actinocorallia aurea]
MTERVATVEAGQGGAGRGGAEATASGERRAWAWRRGSVLAGAAVVLGLVMPLHGWIPNRVWHLGSLVETVLPWSWLFVPVLLAGALRRRSASAVVALLLPVVAYPALFGGALGDRSHGGGDLMVVGHNVGAGNPDPAGTARALASSGADVLALEEVTEQTRGVYEEELADGYPYHSVQGTVGLWSRLPLSDVRAVDTAMDAGPLGDAKPLDVKLRYNRALRATVATAHGPLAVYVAHLGSVRVDLKAGFRTEGRDRNARALAEAVVADPNERLVVLGDFNGTTDDRAFAPLTSRLTSVQDEAGAGFGFTWPAAFPVVRIDQILVKGMIPTKSWVLPPTGSDHLPIAARIAW